MAALTVHSNTYKKETEKFGTIRRKEGPVMGTEGTSQREKMQQDLKLESGAVSQGMQHKNL
jgi:hypothetical protein